MASANHLMTVFLARRNGQRAVVRAGRHPQGPPASSEAALKYAVYGAGAAGVMLYGISLLAGLLGHGPPADDRGEARCRWMSSHGRRRTAAVR